MKGYEVRALREDRMKPKYPTAVRTAVRLGLAVLFAITVLVTHAARADEFAYEANSDSQFGFIDLSTGVFTQLGTLPVTLDGLAVYQGEIYGYGAGSGTLYQVDPTNGKLTMIGTAPFNYRGIGSTTKGIYGFDQDMVLYSIDPKTGAAKKIGATGLSNPSGFGVSSGQKVLYITPTFSAGCSGTYLYSVSTSSGKSKKIGSTSVCGIGALAFEDGVLYGGVFSPTAVYTLNTRTGVASPVADVTGTTGYFYGLVPTAQVAP